MKALSASIVPAILQVAAPSMLLAGLLATTSAYADSTTRAAIDGAGHATKLVTTWGEHPGLALDGKRIYAGEAVATVVSGHGLTVVAYEVAGDKPFRLRIAEDDKLHDPLAFARPAKADNSPFAIAATATPDGFAIFYQEVQNNDPTAAHTYMLELDGEGKASGAPREIQVPWALADAIWDGSGYHLALIYAGGGDGMRLAMVSTTKEGQPQGHPDWSSAPGIITDVHLSRIGDRVLAFYRRDDHLIETDVTRIGSWGQVTSPSHDRGALSAGTVLAINAKGEAIRVK
ncbi:MAG TPA: hypothetical protein VLT45_16670 [Kofleriaceae bacterium]|nr:hypothetical protein [Kofleriaceae bacterium]